MSVTDTIGQTPCSFEHYLFHYLCLTSYPLTSHLMMGQVFYYTDLWLTWPIHIILLTHLTHDPLNRCLLCAALAVTEVDIPFQALSLRCLRRSFVSLLPFSPHPATIIKALLQWWLTFYIFDVSLFVVYQYVFIVTCFNVFNYSCHSICNAELKGYLLTYLVKRCNCNYWRTLQKVHFAPL